MTSPSEDLNPYRPPASHVADLPDADDVLQIDDIVRWTQRFYLSVVIPVLLSLGLLVAMVAAPQFGRILSGAMVTILVMAIPLGIYTLYASYQLSRSLGQRYPWGWPLGLFAASFSVGFLVLIVVAALLAAARRRLTRNGYRLTFFGRIVPRKP